MEGHSIGMFDSGLGGLTVMQQLVKVLPFEDVVYFGDTARLPYGTKSPETVVRYSMENAQFLIQKNIKLLVIACNTASAHALDHLQQHVQIPVMGVIDPGAESALKATNNGRIGVLGTRGTIDSQCYQKAILKLDSMSQVFPVACPLLVPLVEENCVDHPVTRMIIHEYLKPLKEQQIDTLLLGCTHYPLLKHLICEEMGEAVTIVDSARSCAEKIGGILSKEGMHNTMKQEPLYRYFVSDDPKRFQSLGSAFLGIPISQVESV
jgi:glutamate racemase